MSKNLVCSVKFKSGRIMNIHLLVLEVSNGLNHTMHENNLNITINTINTVGLFLGCEATIPCDFPFASH